MELNYQNLENIFEESIGEIIPAEQKKEPVYVNDMIKVEPAKYGLDLKSAHNLTSGLMVIFAERDSLISQYKQAVQMEITPISIEHFKKLRLKIRDNRTKGIEKWHKTTKEYFLAGGKFCDVIKNMESAINEEMEAKLEECEKYYENLEKKRLLDLKTARLAEIAQYMEFVFADKIEELTPEQFDNLKAGAKLQYDAKIEAERKAEAERIEREHKEKLLYERKLLIAPFVQFYGKNELLTIETTAEQSATLIENLKAAKAAYDKEQAEIKAENDRLKAEADRKAKEIEDERKKQAELLAEQKKESDKLAKIEAEKKAAEIAKLKAEADKVAKELADKKAAEIAEQKRIQAEKEAKEKAEKEAAKAPDKEKLIKWVESFNCDNTVSYSTEAAKQKSNEIMEKFLAFKKWAKTQIETI
jgi:colicin import membrane protein